MTDFLQPISEESPSGESLRYDPVYDEIKEARRSDTVDDSMGIWQPANPKGTEWGRVAELCEDVLLTKSKDIQIAFWRTEALGHLEGFPGIAVGLQTFLELMETFWDNVHPQIDEDGDYELRLVPIRNIAQDLPTLFYTIPICEPDSEELPIISYFDFLSSKRGDSDISFDKAQKSVTSTNMQWLKNTHDGTQKVLEHLRRIEEIAMKHCGHSVPSFSETYKIINELVATFKELVPMLFVEPEEEAGEEGEVTADGTVVTKKVVSKGRSISIEDTRKGAYQLLKEAQKILEKADPHSPVLVALRHLNTWEIKGLHEISASLEKNAFSIPQLLKTFPEEIE